MADHKEFANRLNKACDDNPLIPEKNRGRQVYIKNKVGVSQEAVRRWFEGVSRPREKLMKKLAALLRVDEAWLALGVEPEMGGREKKQFSAQASGSDYLMFGLFMANGYSCAFNQEKSDVDFYAIRSGVQRSISVTAGRQKSKGVYQLPVSTGFEEMENIVVIFNGKVDFDILVLDKEGIAKHGERTGPNVVVTANKEGDDYFTEGHLWKRIDESDLF